MSSTVQAIVNYFVPPADGSKPYQHITADPITNQLERNWTQAPHLVQIENIRDHTEDYTLDAAGFKLYKRAAKHTAGASRVILFDHSRQSPTSCYSCLMSDSETRRPVQAVHVDQTDSSAEARVRRHAPAEDVEELLKHRYQIINLWRPIGNPAIDFPLALCDFRSVDAENDLAPTTLILPKPPNGEVMSVKYNPNHKWKYVRGMEPDEFVLLKCFDSRLDVARFTPHTAFIDPTTPPDAPPRQSIELRALVFYD